MSNYFKFLAILILIYPLFVKVFIGLPVNGILLMFISTNIPLVVLMKSKFRRIELYFFFILILSLTGVYYGYGLLPLSYFLGFYVIYNSRNKLSLNGKTINKIYWLYITASLIFIPIDGFHEFEGFAYSATTFSIYLSIITFLNYDSKKFYLKYIISLILIYASGTRSILFLFLILPLIGFMMDRFKSSFKVIYPLIIVSIILMYPLYEFYYTSPDFESYRIDSSGAKEIDYSFVTRFDITYDLIDKYSESNIQEKILGHGSEFTRDYINNKKGSDFQAHNDFIRFLIDFGLFGMILFLILINTSILKRKKNKLILLIFMMSFYHNMIYEAIFLYGLLININKNDKINNSKIIH